MVAAGIHSVSWVKTILGGVIAAGYTLGSQIVCTRHFLLALLHERLTIQASFNNWTPLGALQPSMFKISRKNYLNNQNIKRAGVIILAPHTMLGSAFAKTLVIMQNKICRTS